MSGASPGPMGVARAILGLALEAGTLVWRGQVDARGRRSFPPWREIYGEEQPLAVAVIEFYPGGRVVIDRPGRPIELRKLPGDLAVGPTMVERAIEIGGGALSKALRDISGE